MPEEEPEAQPPKKYKHPCTPRKNRLEKVLSEIASKNSAEEDLIYPEEGGEEENAGEDAEATPEDKEQSKYRRRREILVGESLPYGPRLYECGPDKVVRMKDIGTNKRILLLGVIGCFTPDCWNHHVYRVLQKYEYYKERKVDFICCISTNDVYTHNAWGKFLGCQKKMLMWSDSTTKFTRLIGMETCVPWLDGTIRSKRYVILADDMVVTKMIVAPDDCRGVKWNCDHLTKQKVPLEEEDSMFQFNSNLEIKSGSL